MNFLPYHIAIAAMSYACSFFNISMGSIEKLNMAHPQECLQCMMVLRCAHSDFSRSCTPAVRSDATSPVGVSGVSSPLPEKSFVDDNRSDSPFRPIS